MPTSHLTLSWLGSFQVLLDQRPVTNFGTDKVRALLAYLSVEAECPHRRESLAGLLWGEQPEALARQSLRQALLRLRSALGQREAARYLLVFNEQVQFIPEGDYQVDVTEFTSLLRTNARHAHRRLEACKPCLERLGRAVELYRGDFLHEFFLSDSSAFEEWARLKREQLHRQALDALSTLAAHYEQRGDFEQVRRYAARQIELEPWREEAHRQLMRALAQCGQRGAALTQYEKCCRLLRTDLDAEPEPETTALYEQLRAGRFMRAPGLASSQATATVRNSPVPLTSFINRTRELAQLEDLLQDPSGRLLTLVGVGGVGKTRLAIQAAARVVESFQDGGVFISLDVVPHPGLLLSAILGALGLESRGRDLRQKLLNYLRTKEMLLIVDNLEHLLAEANLLIEILQAAPQVKILVTSRERLNYQTEYVFRVKGLEYPDVAQPIQGLEKYAAVKLFVERARRVQTDFLLDARTAPAVVRICQHVDGVPLAIELAAASVGEIPCEVLAEQIEAGLDCLTTSLRDLPARHRSLRAVLEQSWRLLSEEEQLALGQLAAFSDGQTNDAAQPVVTSSLARLVDKSLVVQDSAGRYHLHPLLQEYVRAKFVGPSCIGVFLSPVQTLDSVV